MASAANKRVEKDNDTLGSRESSDASAAVSRLARGKTDRRWRGVKENSDTRRLYRLEKKQNEDKGS